MKAQTTQSVRNHGLPNEGDWIRLGQLDAHSGKFAVCDLTRLFSHRKADVLPALPGRYELFVREVTDGPGQGVSGLKIQQESQAIRREKIHDIKIDSGRLVVFDPIVFRRHKRRLDATAQETISEQLGSVGPHGLSQLDESAVLVVQPGFGDGCYPVFELVKDNVRVGFELVFIGPDVLPISEGALISKIRATGSASALKRLFHHRTKELGGTGHPTMFDDLAFPLSPQTAFSLIPRASELVLSQTNAPLTIAALGLLLNLVRASNTTEMSLELEDRWAALANSIAKNEKDSMITEMWSDLCRWYRRQ
jgi:hypothetical protein